MPYRGKRGCLHRDDYLGYLGVLWALTGGHYHYYYRSYGYRYREDSWIRRRDEYQRVVLFTGSGFTNACARGRLYPSFKDIIDDFKKELEGQFHISTKEISDVAAIEYYWQLTRCPYRDVINRFLNDHIDLHHKWRSSGPGRRMIPYLPLSDYESWVTAAIPVGQDTMEIEDPHIILGRLIREGFIRQLITTNYDALIELGAWLAGMHVVDAEEQDTLLHPRRSSPYGQDKLGEMQRVGTHDCLIVIEPADHFGQRLLGHRSAYVYKIHGGIRSACDLLCNNRMGFEQPGDDYSLRQKGFFVAAYSDLLDWSPYTWQSTVFEEAFHGGRILMIGASGKDPVTFRHIRKQQERAQQLARINNNMFHETDYPVLAWSYEERSPELEMLLNGPPGLDTGPGATQNGRNGHIISPPWQRKQSLPLAHVKDTVLGFHGLAALFYVRALCRTLAMFGGSPHRLAEDLWNVFEELSGRIHDAVCRDRGLSYRELLLLNYRKLLLLETITVALPRWGTLSMASDRVVFQPIYHMRARRFKPAGPWFIVPFVNSLEGRIRWKEQPYYNTFRNHEQFNALMITFFAQLIYEILCIGLKSDDFVAGIDPYYGAVNLRFLRKIVRYLKNSRGSDGKDDHCRSCCLLDGLLNGLEKQTFRVFPLRLNLFPLFCPDRPWAISRSPFMQGYPGIRLPGEKIILCIDKGFGHPRSLIDELCASRRPRLISYRLCLRDSWEMYHLYPSSF